jgi:hypothetical protein
MLQATTVSTQKELEEIYSLNQRNLKQVLSEEEKKEEGFVTWLYSMDLLEKMHSLAPSIIVKEGDAVVGYALTTLKESNVFHPDLQMMMEHIAPLTYKSRPLNTYSYYFMGQVCVDKNYRGKGVFKILYEHHKQVYSKAYEMLITEVSVSNHRSLKAHKKIGFETIYTYTDVKDTWEVIVWNWR